MKGFFPESHALLFPWGEREAKGANHPVKGEGAG